MQGFLKHSVLLVLLMVVALFTSTANAAGVCNSDVMFWIEEGKLLNGKLQSPDPAPGFHGPLAATQVSTQPAAYSGTCTAGLSFVIVSGPGHHTPSPTGVLPFVDTFANLFNGATGEFQYTNRPGTSGVVWNGYDSFVFTVKCGTVEVCPNSVARINVVYTTAASQNAVQTAFSAGFTNFKKCSGSCTSPFPTRPTLPRLWDNQGNNADAPQAPKTQGTYGVGNIQRNTDEVTFEWQNNYAIITSYSRLGSLAQRFPTYELLKWKNGELFTSTDAASYAHPLSTAFDTQCLDHAGVNQGDEAKDVWDHITGRGPRATSGVNYYQRYNSAQCDIIADTCLYAPLFSPRPTQNEDQHTVWKLEIRNCDVIWTGKVTWNAMRTQPRNSGASSRAWRMQQIGNNHVLTTEFYSQIVQPNSWKEPARGFDTHDTKYQVTISLSQDTQFKFEFGIDIFTVDLEWFRYKKADGLGHDDEAFGYNMIVYPHRLQSLQPSAPDRRVIGFKWRQHSWDSPSAPTMCSTCTGVSTCDHDFSGLPQGSYQGEFPSSQACSESFAPRVYLFKGPATSATDCPGVSSDLIILSQLGLSPPKATVDSGSTPASTLCSTEYQNLTLRGYAPNSGRRQASSYFGFAGSILIEFLLANGEHPHTTINPSIFMKSISVDATFSASAKACLSSPFWPVPNPVNEDLPDMNGGFLCLTPLNNGITVGPTDWVIVTFDVDQMEPDLIDVQEVKIELTDLATPVYFVYRDDQMNDLPVPANQGKFWTDGFKYFNFRNLKTILNTDGTNKLYNLVSNAPSGVQGPENQDFGMAFTPGAFNSDAHLVLSARLRVLTGAVSRRRQQQQRFHKLQDDITTADGVSAPSSTKDPKKGSVIARQPITVNPYLTAQVRNTQGMFESAKARTADANRANDAAKHNDEMHSMETVLISLGAVVGFLMVAAMVGIAMYVRARLKYNTVPRTNSAVTFSVAPSNNA